MSVIFVHPRRLRAFVESAADLVFEDSPGSEDDRRQRPLVAPLRPAGAEDDQRAQPVGESG